jgi:hypothetical protein
MACIYSQIQYGELIALNQISRAVERTPYLWAKLFGATQVMDEARHLEFFSRVLSLFPDKPPIDDRLAAFADSLRSAQSPAELILGTQVLLEGFAHCMFAEGARLGRRASTRAIRMPGTDGAIAFMDVLDRYVGKDETRHVAFGVLYLRHELGRLSPESRRRIERLVDDWSALLDSVVERLGAEVGRLGISSQVLLEQVRRERSVHLRAIGLAGTT